MQQCLTDIENASRNAYMVRGERFQRIRDKRLYRLDHYHVQDAEQVTFEQWCELATTFMKSRVYQLIDAFNCTLKISNILEISEIDLPIKERQVAELLKLKPESDGDDKAQAEYDAHRADVWSRCLDRKRHGETITAKIVL